MPQLLAAGELLARVRRDADRAMLRTRNGLRHLSGVGHVELGVSPKQTVWARDKVELWRYDSDHRTLGPPILLVMSLVSKSYVLDLRPGNSFIEFLIGRGFDVYMLDWGVPDEVEADNSFETYCDEYLPLAAHAVLDHCGADDLTVFGYCFGGILSLLFAAGHPEVPIRNLVVMATPIDFTEMGPMSGMMQDGRFDPDDLIDETGNVPPDAIYDSFRVLKPTADLNNYANLWQNLWKDDFVEAYQAMTTWSRDHIPFPGACFRQTVELFNRQNLLATGQVPLGDRTVDLADITCPFLSIIAEKDHIVPAAATTVLSTLVGSDDVEELRLPAGHVGLVVGRSAAKVTMPAMAEWIERHSDQAL